jgi:hypothetical protein
MPKGDELKFEGGAATKAEREYGNDGGKKRIHAHDCMAAAQKSLGLPDISESMDSRRVVIHSYDAPRSINFLWGRRLVLGLVDRAMSRRLCEASRNLDRRSAAPHADTTVTGGTPMPLAPERLSDLIGLIYDCTIEPDRRPETMHQICDDLGCFLSAIYRVDLESAQISFLRQWNAQLDRLALLEKYGPDVTRIYQTMQAVRNRQIDEPLVLSRHVAREAWVQSRYYTEWAKPRGVCDSCHAAAAPARVSLPV